MIVKIITAILAKILNIHRKLRNSANDSTENVRKLRGNNIPFRGNVPLASIS
jgi:hypothetical protein